MRRRATLLAAMALCWQLYAELPPIQSYSAADGLAGNQINRIVADSHGFIWFLTTEGLSRFDGYRFVNFGVAEGLPHRDVQALLETRSGEYLVGTARGLSRFRTGSGRRFDTYLPGTTRQENAVTALMEDSSGRIWCGTNGGLFEMLRQGTFRLQPLPSKDRIRVTDLLEDRDKRLWIATRAGIYILSRDGSIQRIVISGWTENVRALLLDRSGKVWAGTQDGLILMTGKGVQQVYKEIDGVKQVDVTSLAQGRDGTLWAGVSAGIVRSLPGPGPERFRLMTRAQGLVDRQVNALAIDRGGNIWAGTENAGAMKIQPTGFTTFRDQDGLRSDRVQSVLADREGTILAVTSLVPPQNSLNRFDGSRFNAFSITGFSDRPPWSTHSVVLQARSGAWWAATASGLCMYAPVHSAELAGRKPQACYATDSQVYQILEDSQGRIWASTERLGEDRLMRWDPAVKDVSWVEDGPSRKELVSAFAEDRQGGIWMGLLTGGDLLRYSGHQFTRYGQKDGVPAGTIRELFIDSKGRLWVGSANGLGFVEEPGNARFVPRVYGPADGLASESIVAVTEDSAGRIYVGTARGIDRLDTRSGRIKHYFTADGLAHGGINAAARDRAGDLWFATTQGVSRLWKEADRSPLAPLVRITDLRFGREHFPVSQIGETKIVHADLQPAQNHFQVAFVGFSDEPEVNLQYKYKLVGGDSDWQGPARDHEVNYAELAPRGYRFLVKAINSEGQESEAAAEIDFEILPPVWRRWWFEALALACAASLIFAGYRRRLQGMTARVKLLYEERLDERTRIARELHDTLLQNLAGVSLQLDGVAKQVGASSEGAASQIRTVRQQVDASFREARQKVQDLRSPMLQGRTLPVVLRESLEQIATAGGVCLQLTVSGMPRVARENVDETVLRIGQEAVANAVRHAQAKEILVDLTYDEQWIRLRIRDDGTGFDLNEAGRREGHWGLRNMRERADQVGGRFQISTAAGSGTTIEVAILARTGK